MRLKNIIIIIVIAVIVAVTIGLIFFRDAKGNEYQAPSLVIGETLPKKLPQDLKPIKSTMKSKDMMLTALENHELMEYYAATQIGTVNTDAAGMKFEQSVTARRIKQNSQYYLDAYTATIGTPSIPLNIKGMEETFVNENGLPYFRDAKKSDIGFDKETGLLVAKKYQPKKEYSSLSDYLLEYPNNPTKVFMYKIDASTIMKESTEPIYDRDSKTYKFKIVLDPKNSTTEYLPVIQYMLKGNGMNNAKVLFTKLELTVEMWDKGLLKSIYADEEYNIDAKMVIDIKGKVRLQSTNYYSYNPAEKTMQIKQFREAILGKGK